MTGVDLESGKKPLRERSPFIDVPMINCADKVKSNYHDHNDDEDADDPDDQVRDQGRVQQVLRRHGGQAVPQADQDPLSF